MQIMSKDDNGGGGGGGGGVGWKQPKKKDVIYEKPILKKNALLWHFLMYTGVCALRYHLFKDCSDVNI